MQRAKNWKCLGKKNHGHKILAYKVSLFWKKNEGIAEKHWKAKGQWILQTYEGRGVLVRTNQQNWLFTEVKTGIGTNGKTRHLMQNSDML